jgi:hypothetical protein
MVTIGKVKWCNYMNMMGVEAMDFKPRTNPNSMTQWLFEIQRIHRDIYLPNHLLAQMKIG